MYTSLDIRWQQRFENYSKSLTVLTSIAQIETPNEAEMMGNVQAFEVCFELAWKTLKDYLEAGGYDVKSPRDVIKQALQDELISDGHVWIDALEKRNQAAHMYDMSLLNILVTQTKDAYLPLFIKLHETLKKL